MTIQKINIQEEVEKFLRKQASKGGKNTVKKHGTKHFSDIAKKRWAKQKGSVDKSIEPNE